MSESVRVGKGQGAKWGRVCIGLLVLCGALVALFTLPLEHILAYMKSHPTSGAPIFSAVYVTMLVLCIPSTIMEIACGFLFPFWLAFPLAAVSKYTGCALSFLLGRYLLIDLVQSRVLTTNNTLIRVLHTVTARDPLRVCVLIRLAVLPMAVKNYGLAVLPCSFVQFSIACILTGSPLSALWTLLGGSASQLADILHSQDPAVLRAEMGLFVGGALVMAGTVAMISIKARHEWRKLEDEVIDGLQDSGAHHQTEAGAATEMGDMEEATDTRLKPQDTTHTTCTTHTTQKMGPSPPSTHRSYISQEFPTAS